jgi:urea carboxylase
VEIGRQTTDVRVTSRIRLLVQKIEALKIPGLVMPNIGCLFSTLIILLIARSRNDPIRRQNNHPKKAPPNRRRPRDIHRIHDRCYNSLSRTPPPSRLGPSRYRSVLTAVHGTNRPTAAHLPDTVEYLCTNNGLSSRHETFETLLKSQMSRRSSRIPCRDVNSIPLEPRSTILGQKYNPTRVSTLGGTIKIGGSLYTMYPVEAPGGYLLFARTMECWDTFGNGPSFQPSRLWLFEPFHIARYYEVSVAEYDQLIDYRRGK